MLEEMFLEDPNNIPDSWKADADAVEENDASLPTGFEDVQQRSYDHDFWDLLLEKHLGGSDALEVMAGINVPKTAPHIIHCTTGDAFDHTVLVGGAQPTQWKPDPGDSSVHNHSFPHVYPNPMDTRSSVPAKPTAVHQTKHPAGHPSKSSPAVQSPGHPDLPWNVSSCTPPSISRKSQYTSPPGSRPHSSPPPPPPPIPPVRETRPLSEISDEEFDVPPIFDDLAYEAEDVPDLFFDAKDEELFVGKLYATK
ncbi:Uncharacterized protein Rs2_21885 [Raphanus sativus]|nr:Uncharacterized protein Rs2_21885 [Raphanus sativus]